MHAMLPMTLASHPHSSGTNHQQQPLPQLQSLLLAQRQHKISKGLGARAWDTCNPTRDIHSPTKGGYKPTCSSFPPSAAAFGFTAPPTEHLLQCAVHELMAKIHTCNPPLRQPQKHHGIPTHVVHHLPHNTQLVCIAARAAASCLMP